MDPCVVHVVQKLVVGGIETLVLDLMRLNRSRDIVVSLEGRFDDLADGWPALKPLQDRVVAMDKRAGFDFVLPPRLVRTLRRIRPDAVILHHLGPLIYGALAARVARVPEVHHFEHDVWHYSEASHVKHLRWAERVARPHHFAVSDEVKARLLELVPDGNVSVAAPGIDMRRFLIADQERARAGAGLPARGRIVGTVGRLAAVKGHRHLIDAMAHVAPDVSLAVVGDGPERAGLEARVRELGLDARVHFLGQRDGIEAILPAFDIFCLPSLSEGLPRAILEAQACGLPVVASDVGAVRSALDPQSGVVVAAGDPTALAAALDKAFALERPSRSARAFVETRYTLEKLHGQLSSSRGAAA